MLTWLCCILYHYHMFAWYKVQLMLSVFFVFSGLIWRIPFTLCQCFNGWESLLGVLWCKGTLSWQHVCVLWWWDFQGIQGKTWKESCDREGRILTRESWQEENTRGGGIQEYDIKLLRQWLGSLEKQLYKVSITTPKHTPLLCVLFYWSEIFCGYMQKTLIMLLCCCSINQAESVLV